MAITSWLDSFRQDLRFSGRLAVKSPAFFAVVILTLALGIGANTAVFSIINSLLLKPYPFPEPERVVRIYDTQMSFTTAPAAYREYVDWRDQNRVFQAIGGVWPFLPTLTGTWEPELLRAGRVTASFFHVFAAPPILGRWFTEDEDRPGGPSVAILTEGLWARRFGRDAAVIGRAITLDGVPRTVVGVMPDGPFEALWRLEVFVPLAMALDRQEGLHNLAVFGRLKPGVSVELARDEMVALGRRLAVENQSNHGIDVQRYRDSLIAGVVATPALMLFAVVTVVLLIACANVANLLLARATSRRREIAVRVAVGASRGRLARQMLAESTLLALAGGGVGFIVAWGSVRALVAAVAGAVPRTALPMLPSIGMDWRVLLFTLGVALLTGVVFGMAPMASDAGRRVSDALKEDSGRSAGSPAARRLGSALVVAEIALSVMLLSGAGLLVKSLARLGEQQLGIVSDRVLAFDVSLPEQRYGSPDLIRTFYRQAYARLRGTPGVTAVGMTTSLPLHNPNSNAQIQIDGKTLWKPGESPLVDMRWVGGDYFQALKVPLIRGRVFTDQDDGRAPMVAVVNQSMATGCWPGQDPIGKRVEIWDTWRLVVGIVGDVRSHDPSASPVWEVDVPAAQQPSWAMATSFALRTSLSDPSALAGDVRRAIAAVDPTLALSNLQTMDDVVRRSLGAPRLLSTLTAGFALLAALLAAIGTYGLMAYTVGQRTREFGVRMAMGSDSAAVLRLVLARGMKLAGAGVVLGAIAAAGVARLMASLLFQVAPGDPWVLAIACGAILAAALAACYVPARWAARVDPMVALRVS